MMPRRRSEFTDLQKAEIFKRDRATCGLSGRNLWFLDFGADPNYQVDWVDHILPAAKGGQAHVENGICTSWYLNYVKRDHQYYGKAAFRALQKWRAICAIDNCKDFERRRLLPASLTNDQKLMLELRNADDESSVRRLMKALLPHFLANERALEYLASNRFSAARSQAILAHRLVSPRIRKNILGNIRILRQLHAMK